MVDIARLQTTQPWRAPHVASIAPGAKWDNLTMCALAMEYAPVQGDSRLVFDAYPFPEGFEESYALAGREEHQGQNRPQPLRVTYKGGSWGDITLNLKFRAGMNMTRRARSGIIHADPNNLSATEVEQVLRDMERKVNWCMALGFQLERPDAWKNYTERPTWNNSGRASWRQNDPPFVLLILGTWRIIRGYVTSISVTWQAPWHPVSGRPYGATVRLSIKPMLRHYPSWESIRNSGSNAGADSKYLESLRQANEGTIGRVERATLAKQADARSAAEATSQRAATIVGLVR